MGDARRWLDKAGGSSDRSYQCHPPHRRVRRGQHAPRRTSLRGDGHGDPAHGASAGVPPRGQKVEAPRLVLPARPPQWPEARSAGPVGQPERVEDPPPRQADAQGPDRADQHCRRDGPGAPGGAPPRAVARGQQKQSRPAKLRGAALYF